MRLLHRLCRCEAITKMGALQFGVCFGPTLLRAQQPQQEAMDVASGINAKVRTDGLVEWWLMVGDEQ